MIIDLHNFGKKELNQRENLILLLMIGSVAFDKNINVVLKKETMAEKTIDSFFSKNKLLYSEYSINSVYGVNDILVAEYDEKKIKSLEKISNFFLFSFNSFSNNEVKIKSDDTEIFILKKSEKKENIYEKDVKEMLNSIYLKVDRNENIQKIINDNAKLQNEISEYKNKYNSLKTHLSYQLGNLLVNETKNIKDVFNLPKNFRNIYNNFKKRTSVNSRRNKQEKFNYYADEIIHISNLIDELLYHPFSDRNDLLNKISFCISELDSNIVLRNFIKLRELLLKVDALFLLKDYVILNYTKFPLSFNFENFEILFQMIYYYDESQSRIQCFDYIKYLESANLNKFKVIIGAFIAEIKSVYEKNGYWDIFINNKVELDQIYCSEDFVNKYIKSPLSLNSLCNDLFRDYLIEYKDKFNYLTALYLYVILNKESIDYNLFVEFFKISKNKNIFINSVRRFTYKTSTLSIFGDFNEEDFSRIIEERLVAEDFIYLSMFDFYSDRIKNLIKNKIGSSNIPEETYHYVNSRLGNSESLFSSINFKLNLTGLSLIEGYDDVKKLSEFYNNYVNNSSNKIDFNIGKISIIMTCYNSNIELLKSSIKSILIQSYKNIELIVIDDCSQNCDDIERLVNSFGLSNILYYKMEKNSGPYICRNIAISLMSGDFIAFQDDDDISHIDRLYYEVKYLIENKLKVVYTSNLRFDINFKLQTDDFESIYSTGPVTMLFHKSIIDEVGLFKPFKSRGDIAFRKRCEKIYGESKVGQIHIPLYYCRGSMNSNSSNFEFNGNLINLKLIRSIISFDSKPKLLDNMIKKDHVFGCMASFPARAETLKRTVKNIINQIDHLYIYLNDYNYVPDFLKHDKITVILGHRANGDLRDNGKIYPVSELTPKGYCFLFDDDINYPNDYVIECIRKLSLYKNKVAIGLHGVIFEKPFKNYFNNRTLFHFKNENIQDVVVNQLGTGALAFHTDAFRPNLNNYIETGMADVFFAIEAKNNKLPLICIEHRKSWLKPWEIELEDKTNLYDEFRYNDNLQTKYISEAGVFTEIDVKAI